MPEQTPTRSRWPLLGGLVMILIVSVVLLLLKPWNQGQTQLIAAAEANARGVGHMEQFDTPEGYPLAIKEFEKAVQLAPSWTPAKVNLGIALYNTAQSQTDPVLDRASQLFREVLQAEPENPYAHYNLGMIYLYRNELPEAAREFEAVTRIDPNDPHAWYHRGITHPQKDDAPEAKSYFEKALKLDPYLNAARYALALHAHERDEAKTRELLNEKKALEDANWETEYRIRYSEMGKYAEVIGKPPTDPNSESRLPVFEQTSAMTLTLKEGTNWASVEQLRDVKALRDQHGGTLLRWDYDGDGRPDVLLLGAVLRDGVLADLLLHNDGNGQFSDQSALLPAGPASISGAIADYDNDGKPDLVLTNAQGVRLLRNQGGKPFEDTTKAAKLDTLNGSFTNATWLDLDQDSDLDLLLSRAEGGLLVALNVGEAKPGEDWITTAFDSSKPIDGFTVRGKVNGIVATDIDNDRDVDIVLLMEDQPPRVLLNDRLLRFRSGPTILEQSARWLGGLVLDSSTDFGSALLLLEPNGFRQLTPLGTASFNSTPGEAKLIQAHVQDLNLDGYADIVGLDQIRRPVLLQGQPSGKLKPTIEPFGPTPNGLASIQSLAVADFLGDGQPSLLVWTDSGLSLFKNTGVGNNGLMVQLTGRRDKGSNLRTNSDGIGSTVEVLAGTVRTRQENTTLQAGLGQSRLPLWFGLRNYNAADAVRVRWPDGVPQSELNQPAGQLSRIVEQNRKGTSCPILLTWDGSRYRYVTDFLGGGALAELGPDGSIRPPRPEESIKIEADQLALKDGQYAIKLAEPMDEVMYLDHLRLDVIDHPIGTEVFPDERFSTGGPAPTQELQLFAKKYLPQKATDHRGTDQLAALRERDGVRVDGFIRRSWLGFAEEHFLELDFADQLKALPKGPLTMVLAGWIDYPYPESIYAASQAGVPMLAPVLERETHPGQWSKLCDLGFPAGLPKVMTRDVSELVGQAGVKLRIRTNLQIYWDQIYLGQPSSPSSVTPLTVSQANLFHRGFMQEIARGGSQPVEYNDARTESVSVTRWKGKLTRLGDVTPLLTSVNDEFVLCGPGDEVLVQFDARALPPVPSGSIRSFVLRTFGYCKDTSPFTLTGGEVSPLPHRGMTSYPVDITGAPATQRTYDEKWNSR